MKNEALTPYAGSGHLAKSEELINHIRDLYGQEAARAILFLLHHVEARTKDDFLCHFVYKAKLVHEPTIDIIIKPLDWWLTMRGNLGRYMVFVRKDANNERLLRFTNQTSLVYYLMYLIDRCNCQPSSSCGSVVPPLKLRMNRIPFMELYKKVYAIDNLKLEKRYQRLLYREDLGHLRAGRETECIYDIRMHLKEVFSGYNESYFPYAMTAHSHLAIGASHICFEGEAQTLLELHFR